MKVWQRQKSMMTYVLNGFMMVISPSALEMYVYYDIVTGRYRTSHEWNLLPVPAAPSISCDFRRFRRWRGQWASLNISHHKNTWSLGRTMSAMSRAVLAVMKACAVFHFQICCCRLWHRLWLFTVMFMWNMKQWAPISISSKYILQIANYDY